MRDGGFSVKNIVFRFDFNKIQINTEFNTDQLTSSNRPDGKRCTNKSLSMTVFTGLLIRARVQKKWGCSIFFFTHVHSPILGPELHLK